MILSRQGILFLNLVGLVFNGHGLIAAQKVVTLWDDLIEDTTFRTGYTYIVSGVVHVPSGVKLTVEEGAEVLIKNGKIKRRLIDRAALIFDQGSILKAENMVVRAAGANGRPEKKSDNGGLWFLGSFQDSSKDGVSVVVKSSSRPSHFVAKEIDVSDLGTLDPNPSPRVLNPRGDDIDGFSVLGVGPSEWKIEKVRSDFSGDDGFDVTNSQIELKELTIFSPFEDGLNISSSRMRVTKKLEVDMTRNSSIEDRDIFDLEVDDGPSYVTLAEGCRVDIDGVWGDELKLRSSDLPKPESDPKAKYSFHGLLRHGPATIYSRTED